MPSTASSTTGTRMTADLDTQIPKSQRRAERIAKEERGLRKAAKRIAALRICSVCQKEWPNQTLRYACRHEGFESTSNERSDVKTLMPHPVTVVGAAAGRRFAIAHLRKSVLGRDRFRCRYCGRAVRDDNANIDHVVAWPDGLTVINNLVTCCRPCNQAKGTRMYVIPRPISGQPWFWLSRPRKSRTFSRRHHSVRTVRSKSKHGVRDPWIREGPQVDGRT